MIPRRLLLRIAIWIGIGASAINGYTQSPHIDSLIQLLDTDELTDSAKMLVYRQVIWPNTVQNKEKALELTSDMLRIAQQHSWERWIRIGHYYYGTTYKNANEYERALTHFDTVYLTSLTNGDSSLAINTAYQKMAVYKMSNQLEKAILWSNRTIAGYKSAGDRSSHAMTLGAKGGIYRTLGMYQESLKSYQEGLGIYRTLNDSLGIAQVSNNIGNVYSEMDSFELANRYYSIQEDMNEGRKDTIGLGYVYENRGRLFQKMGLLERASTELESSLSIRRRFKQPYLTAVTLQQLGSVQYEMKRLDLAKKSVEEAMSIAEPLDLKQVMSDGLHLQASIASSQGDFEDAYRLQEKYLLTKDELLNEKISEQVLRIDAETDYENQRRQQQMDLLSAQSELQKIRLQQSNRLIAISLIGMGTVMLFLFWIFRSRNQLQLVNEELSDQRDIVRKALDEKEFLLKEIHHRVKNNLQVVSSLLRLQSRNSENEDVQRVLRESNDRVRSMALIHQNLYGEGSSLSTINVRDYLVQLVTSLARSYERKIDPIYTEVDVEDLKLDIDTSIPIGLIVNELVSNSLKHAFPNGKHGQISVSLKELDHEQLELVVSDDGIGYDPTKIDAQSFGLRMIKSFAQRLRATSQVSAAHGTRSSFQFPRLKS